MREGYEHLGEIVVSEEDIRKRTAELAAELAADYSERVPLLVGVLKGALIFMGDLIRELDIPLEIDMMAISSYGSATSTSGVVRIIKDLSADDLGLARYRSAICGQQLLRRFKKIDS